MSSDLMLAGRAGSNLVGSGWRRSSAFAVVLACIASFASLSATATASPTPSNPDFSLRPPTPSESVSAPAFIKQLNTLQFGTSVVPMTAGTTEAFVTRDGASFWENYPPPTTQLGPLAVNTRVGWRYNYDSNYAVVLRYQTSQWGFILRGSITCCKNDGSPN